MYKNKRLIFSCIALILTAVLLAVIYWYLTLPPTIENQQRHEEIRQALTTGETPGVFIYLNDKMKTEFSKVKYGFKYQKPDSIKRLIVLNLKGGLGDEFSAKRTKIAAEEIGWEVVIINTNTMGNKNLAGQLFNRDAINFIQPDFVISQHAMEVVEGIPHYLVFHMLFDMSEKTLRRSYRQLKNYAGMISVFGDDRMIVEMSERFKRDNKPFFYTTAYFSSPQKFNDFQKTQHNKIFYCGARWDSRRSGEEFSSLITKLDQDNILDLYGPDVWKEFPDSYKGFLPYDYDTFLNTIKKSGISLVIHSQFHYSNNIPSSRIFEAAAASSVIIADDLKFTRDNFGDSVLYLSPELSGQKLYDQIANHYQWIQDNPEKASILAHKANSILREKFSLESQLNNIEKMHKEYMNR